MKLLLDECIDWRLKNFISEHDVRTVQEMGWLGKVNGELLNLVNENSFNVFVTVDKKLRFQQNLNRFRFAIIVFDTPRSTLEKLKSLVPKMISLLPTVIEGKVYEIQ